MNGKDFRIMKKAKNHYICFFDLLGTKALAQADTSEYVNTIHTFENVVQRYVEKGFQEIECHIFSDSAYLETKNINKLCLFLQRVREELLMEQICFNAAVRKGKLGSEWQEKAIGTKGSLLSFTNKDTVEVYSQQVGFGGAGIYIEENILKNPKVKELLVESRYASVEKDGKFQIHIFWDVKFQYKDISLLEYIMHLLLENYILNTRASRYYITMFYTFINEMWDKVDDSSKKKIIDIVVGTLNLIQDKEYKKTIVFLFLNIICTKTTDYLTIDDIGSEVYEYLDYTYMKMPLNNLYDLCTLSSSILSDKNKKILSRFMSNRMISE